MLFCAFCGPLILHITIESLKYIPGMRVHCRLYLKTHTRNNLEMSITYSVCMHLWTGKDTIEPETEA